MSRDKSIQGELQDSLIQDIHMCINKLRVEVGQTLTYAEILGCLESVKMDILLESRSDSLLDETSYRLK